MHMTCIEEAVHKTLKTLEEIVDEADTTFTDKELMEVKQCFSILEKFSKAKEAIKD